jgi:Right handed beta helix region
LSSCGHSGAAVRFGLFGQTTGHGSIQHVLIDDYQAQGVGVYNLGSAATIANNVITGVGRSTTVEQVGIEVVNGAAAIITNNTVSANMCDSVDLQCGPDPMSQFQSVGIGVTLGGASATIGSNDVSSNDVGVYLAAAPACCIVSSNRVFDNRFFGLIIQDGSNSASHDRISGGRVGVAVVADSVNTVGTFRNESISATSLAPVQELSCCGFTATAVVQP